MQNAFILALLLAISTDGMCVDESQREKYYKSIDHAVEDSLKRGHAKAIYEKSIKWYVNKNKVENINPTDEEAAAYRGSFSDRDKGRPTSLEHAKDRMIYNALNQSLHKTYGGMLYVVAGSYAPYDAMLLVQMAYLHSSNDETVSEQDLQDVLVQYKSNIMGVVPAFDQSGNQKIISDGK